jgi:hypothetical protein
MKDGFLHPTTALVDRTLASEDASQATSLGLQQNGHNEGHGDDDLDDV